MNFDSIESELAMFSRALKQTSVALYSSLHGKARWKLAGSLLGNALMVRRLRQDSSFSPWHEAVYMAKRWKKRTPNTILKLPDLEQSKSAVLNSLTSPSSQRSYDHAIRDFIEWY